MPIPIGNNLLFGLESEVEDELDEVTFDNREDSETREDACFKAGSRSVGFVPGPMKPMPPALETATASAGPDRTRMGAPTTMGWEAHG